MSTTQEYRIRLDAAQADLTAVTLAGSGTLAAPGNAAKAALQSLLTMINGLDEVITRAWNEQAIQNLLVVDAAKWSAEHSQEFASPERLAVRQDDYLSGRRDELVLDAVIALARVQHTRMMGPRNAAESAMIAFTAAVIAFAGDPAELAIGRAALTALDNVAGALGGWTQRPMFTNDATLRWSAAADDFGPRLWSLTDWPGTCLSEGR